MEISKVKTLNGNVLVRDNKKEERSAGGLYIPENTSPDHIVKGEVIASSKIRLEDGSVRDEEVIPGDKVVYSFTAGAGNAWEEDGDMYRMVKPSEILAKLHE